MADSIADRKDESAIDLFWFKKGVFGIFEFTDEEIKAAESSNQSKLTGICKLCKPVKTSISGRKNVSSNFLKHARVSNFW